MSKKFRFKNRVALCLAGSVFLGTAGLPSISVAAMEGQSRFLDTKGHWASDAIERMSEYQLVNGYNGLFRPSDPITRGEMSIIIDHIMGYQKEADNIFIDLEEAFYTDAVLKAYEADLLLEANGLVRPKDNITREEVAFMVYNAFDIESSQEVLSFLDSDQVSPWAMEAVNALAAEGIIVGSEGKFNPQAPITRAEAVTILNRLLTGYYNEEGTYTGEVNGKAVISTSDANLKDVVIKGDLIIAEGVAEGDVVLENVVVEGRTIIRGGGVNSIKVEGDSKLGDVLMAKEGSAVRLAVSDSSKVNDVTVGKQATDVVVEGPIDKVKVEAKGAKLTVQNADIQAIEVVVGNAKVELKGKTNIKEVTINKDAANTQIDVAKDAKVKTVSAEAKAIIDGAGKVSKVNANANDIVVKTEGTEVKAEKGTTGVMAGKEPVKGGTSSNTSKPSSSGSSSSSESSSGSGSSNNNKPEEKPEEQPLSIDKVESVKNGLVRVTLNKATDKALIKDQFSIICTGAGKDMTVLSVSTKDNKVYDLTTSYFDDNTYSLGIILEDGKLIEKDFVSKYDCPAITSTKMVRVDENNATFSFVSDTPGNFYYGLSKDAMARTAFDEEPTAEELIEKGIHAEMNLHLNTLQIGSLDAQTPYTLYYVAVDQEGKVTPVKSIQIAAEPIKAPEESIITIESAKGFAILGADVSEEMAGFDIVLSEATQEPLTIEQFEITCPAESDLTLGRVETKDNKKYTVYMKLGYMFNSGNTYTVTIRFKDNTVATKDFYGDVEAPVLSRVNLVATTGSALQVEFNSNEGGTIYYQVLEWDPELHGTSKPKDATEIYETGYSQKIDFGFNRIKGIMAKEGQAFCFATEDALGNRTFNYDYYKVPAYVEPEPEKPDTIKIIDIKPGVDGFNRPYVEVKFNQVVKIQNKSPYMPEITNIGGKGQYEITYKGGDYFTGSDIVTFTIVNKLKIQPGEHRVRVYIDGKLYEGTFTTTEVIG